MNIFNDGCDAAFEHKLRTEHETFCKIVHDVIREYNDYEAEVEAEALIIEAFVDAMSRLIPDAQLDIVSRSENCYRTACSNCGTSWIVSKNIPFEDWRTSKPFCVKCGAKLKKGTETCKATSTD